MQLNCYKTFSCKSKFFVATLMQYKMQKQHQTLFTKLIACIFVMFPIVQLLHHHEQIDQTIVGKVNSKKTFKLQRARSVLKVY
ncbi:hypothetical protein ACVWYN_002822 [Pedobacter sp. UYP24]